MAEEKRIRRTTEQIVADIESQIGELTTSIEGIESKKAESAAAYDEKIAKVNARIDGLLEKKKNLMAPKKRKRRRSKATQIKSIIKSAQKSGLKVQDIAEKLGVELSQE